MTRRFATILVVVLATVALQAGRTPPAWPHRRPPIQASKSRSPGIRIGRNSRILEPHRYHYHPGDFGPRAAPLGSRAMAMMHVAMADAVASIRRTSHTRCESQVTAAPTRSQRLLQRHTASSCGCSRQASCNSTLRSPSRSRRFRRQGKDRGIALGDEVAAQMALRENDGSSMGLTYTPPTGLGYWQPDPRTGASPFLSLGQRHTLDHGHGRPVPAEASAHHPRTAVRRRPGGIEGNRWRDELRSDLRSGVHRQVHNRQPGRPAPSARPDRRAGGAVRP